MSDNFYTGGSEYYITSEKGTHHIKQVGFLDNGENNDEIVFTGSYEKCLTEKQRIIVDNFEYDMNL